MMQRPRAPRPDDSPELGYPYAHFAAQGRLTAPVRRPYSFEQSPAPQEFLTIFFGLNYTLALQPTDLVAELVDRLSISESRQRSATVDLHRQLMQSMRAELRGAVEQLSGEIRQNVEAVAARQVPAAAAAPTHETADTVPVSPRMNRFKRPLSILLTKTMRG